MEENCKDLKGCPFGPYPMNMSTHGRTGGCTPHTGGTGRDGSCPPPWEKGIRQSRVPQELRVQKALMEHTACGDGAKLVLQGERMGRSV